MSFNYTILTNEIKQEALRQGFSACGVSKVRFLHEDAHFFENYLKNNYHAEMKYLENNFDKRLNPALLVDGAKSVISVLMNYFPEKEISNKKSYKISKYAYGKDYHHIIKDKLKALLEFIRNNTGEVNGRAFVDSAPVLERRWANLSGLGWIGNNGNLITKYSGSFFFIGELIVDIELSYDNPSKNFCGTCNKCIDACPTGAIVKPGVIDSRKCISYLTIEYKDKLPENLRDKLSDNIFGCDICQDVCPWNKKSLPTNETAFSPHESLFALTKDDWQQLSHDRFNEIFRKSAVKRTKFEGLMRNISFLKKKGK